MKENITDDTQLQISCLWSP